MKKSRNYLRKPHFFLSVFVFPLALFIANCPDEQYEPPQTTILCEMTTINLDARKCRVIEPPLCQIPVNPTLTNKNWKAGDTFSINASGTNILEPPLNYFFLAIDDIRVDENNIMKRLCQAQYDVNLNNIGIASYVFTTQGELGSNNINLRLFRLNELTVRVSRSPILPTVYIQKDSSQNLSLRASAGGGTEPFNYSWFANGTIIQNETGTSLEVNPTQNTEYKVMVADNNGFQTSDAVFVFVKDNSNDPTASFSISPNPTTQDQTATFDPTASLGSITRWEWDFDWQGDVAEPFDVVINGSDGTTTNIFEQPGRTYVRLRVTTSDGHVHETFQGLDVNAP